MEKNHKSNKGSEAAEHETRRQPALVVPQAPETFPMICPNILQEQTVTNTIAGQGRNKQNVLHLIMSLS